MLDVNNSHVLGEWTFTRTLRERLYELNEKVFFEDDTSATDTCTGLSANPRDKMMAFNEVSEKY